MRCWQLLAQAEAAPPKVLDHSSTPSSPFSTCQAVCYGVQCPGDARHDASEKSTEASRNSVDEALKTPSNAGAYVAEARKDGTHGCERRQTTGSCAVVSRSQKSVCLLLDHIQIEDEEFCFQGS